MHWRNTMHTIGAFGVDARAAVPLLLFLGHVRWWSFWLAMGSTVFFCALCWAGLSLPACARRIRSRLVGRARPAVPVVRRRGFA